MAGNSGDAGDGAWRHRFKVFPAAGIPTYGYSAIALERDDYRAHGKDERLPLDSFWKSLNFFYSYAKALGGN